MKDYDKWEAVYIERCTYGFGARLWKPTLETRQGAVVLAYNIQREDILPSEKAKVEAAALRQPLARFFATRARKASW